MSQVAEISSREEKKPYVRFERVAEDDVAETLKQGHYVAKDVDYVLVTPPYSKDVFKQKVKNWFEQVKVDANNGRIPEVWLHDYKKMYEMWLNGQEMPLNGTPIKGWGVISPAQQETLIRMNCLTVENLATINDEGIRRIGMGGMDLRNKAAAWLAQLNDKGALTVEMAAVKNENATLKASLENLERLVNELRKGQPETVEINRDAMGISASDIIESNVVDLSAQYEAKFGKKPHHLMKEDTIRAKLAE